MVELWGKRNVARLADESGVDRPSVSKILGYKRGLGEEVAAKLAIPLGLEPSALLPPKAERVTLAHLGVRLEDIADAGARTRVALLESLASIDARLSQIEAQLGLQDGRGSEAQ